jgi:ribosomal protein S18 acetylase RimI-like enzyme
MPNNDEFTIRSAVITDLEAVKAIAVETNMFTVDDVESFNDMFDAHVAAFVEGHQWIVGESKAKVVAAAYFAPEPFSDRLWNLYFIAVSPKSQGQRLGANLLRHVEQTLEDLGEGIARVLIVETSATDHYQQTRQFYRNNGYDEEARIRQFYGPNDDKIVFWKALRNAEQSA